VSGRLLRWLMSWGAGARDVRRGPPRLTIVRHHRVFADGERPLYALGVFESTFRAQVEVCVRAGLTPVTVRDGLEFLRRGEPGHAVAFSFDDGYADNVERALPILARFGARATFYLAAGLMESRTAPWWDELVAILERGAAERGSVSWGGERVEIERASDAGRRAALVRLLPRLRAHPAEQRVRLDALRAALRAEEPAPCELAPWALARGLAEAGMELGSHTLTHPYLSFLPEDEQRRQLADAAALIRERTGAEVTGAAYPNGDHDAVTVRAARACDFAYAVATTAGDCAPGDLGPDDRRFALPRRALPEGACTGPAGFSRRMTLAELSGAFDALRERTREAAS